MPRGKLIVAVAAGLVGIVVTTSLGNWQTQRGNEKARRQAQWDAAQARAPSAINTADDLSGVAADLPVRVRLTGRFVPEATVYIDNRLLDGVVGMQVITPLVIDERAPWILVNRGWAPSDFADRSHRPSAPVSSGLVAIEGVAVDRVPRVLDLGDRGFALGGFWPNLDLPTYERVSGHAVARFVVQQTSEAADGLKRVWPRPDVGVERHRGYAFQWYGLAALITVLTAVFGVRSFYALRSSRRP